MPPRAPWIATNNHHSNLTAFIPPFTPTTMSKEERIGTLIVVVLKAKNLIDRHSFYKQDVFCQISLNGAHSVGGKGVRKGR